MSIERVKYLVADTTAFINNVQLHEYAEEIFTVPDIVQEVKNKRQIRRLCVIPYDLKVREPQSENIAFVTEFSKNTGDYASLSAIDLKLCALTYEMHKEHMGTDGLRTEPPELKIIASKQKPEEIVDNTKLIGFYKPKKHSTSESDEINDAKSDDDEKPFEEVEKFTKTDLAEMETAKEYSNEYLDEEDEDDRCLIDEQLKKCLEEISLEESADICNEVLIPEKKENDSESENEKNEIEDNNDVDDDDDDDDDDDESAWITPSNIKELKKTMAAEELEETVPIVACMTTDYAIQNVLKQINLNICALNGRVIRHVRTYILRCYACFKTTSVMTKVFCPNCGNKTLKKVAVSLDENGKQVIHINTRRPLTAKYKNQSLPRFQGGKHSRNVIVSEDQPIPKQMPSRVAKTKTNALEEDYIAGFSPFVSRDTDSKSAMLRSQGNIKQWANNNSFEEQRRKKRFNRLVK